MQWEAGSFFVSEYLLKKLTLIIEKLGYEINQKFFLYFQNSENSLTILIQGSYQKELIKLQYCTQNSLENIRNVYICRVFHNGLVL